LAAHGVRLAESAPTGEDQGPEVTRGMLANAPPEAPVLEPLGAVTLRARLTPCETSKLLERIGVLGAELAAAGALRLAPRRLVTLSPKAGPGLVD